MKFSIIVPFHKYGQFLEDCLASIAESNLENYETILILDHVEEDIQGLIDKYQENTCLKVVELPEGKTGVAAARNAGIDAAQGEYVYFLDSDDYLYEDCLNQLAEAAKDSAIDIIYGKKRYTWFKRAIYLSVTEEKRREEDNAEKNRDGAEELSGPEDTVDAAELEVDEHVRALHKLVKSRRGLRNITVLNIMIKKSFLDAHSIRFREEFRLYPDMPFVVELLKYGTSFTYCKDASYIKRKHNDAILMPALSQEKVDTRMEEQMETFLCCREIAGADGELRMVLDKKLVNYFTKFFAPKLRRGVGEHWRTSRFDLIVSVLEGTHPEVLKGLKSYNKKLVAAGLKHDADKALKIINRKLAKEKVVKILKNKNELYKYLYKNHYLKEPIEEKWIMFESFLGKNYSDSPKYIYEYLAKHNTEGYKFIWAINNDTKPPYGGIVVKRFSREYVYYLAKCKYFVFNNRQPTWFMKREGQVFLQTWHGTPLKRLVFDMEDVMSANASYKMNVYRQSRQWDYMVSDNPFSTEVFGSAFLYPKEQMLEHGYPRNDIMHWPNKDNIAKSIREKLGIPTDKKTVLYAPTWRDDEFHSAGKYKFKLALDLDLMREKLGDDCVVLLRTHYFIADVLDLSEYEGFVYNVCKYDDISELYLISDICITDYSSVFFDYANLKRPVLYYTYDLEKYRDMLRGFYIDMEKDIPGPLLFTTEEVIDAIKNIDQIEEQYKERYEAFYNRFCCWDDGHASDRIVEDVFFSKK